MKYVIKCAKSKLRECEESASKVVLQEELCVAAFVQIFRPWDSHPRLHLVKFLLFSIWNGFVEHLRNGVFLHLHLVTDKFNREQGIRIRRALFLFISPELDRFRRHKLWRLTSKGRRRQYSEVHPPFENSDGHFSLSYSYNTDPRPWTEYNEIDILLCITCCWKYSPRISLTIGLFYWHWFCSHCWSIAMSNLQLRPKIGFAINSLRYGF